MTLMEKQIRWGVIGCGGIASRRMIPELVQFAKNAKLVSVMDVNPVRASEVAAQFDVAHHCSSESELLAQDLDAIPSSWFMPSTVRDASAGWSQSVAVAVDA
jgi:hypothetical protein